MPVEAGGAGGRRRRGRLPGSRRIKDRLECGQVVEPLPVEIDPRKTARPGRRLAKRPRFAAFALFLSALAALALSLTLLSAAEAPGEPGVLVDIDEEIESLEESRPTQRDRAAIDAPLLALVIDDWGYGWDAADDFLSLDVPLNVAVIPHLPYSRSQAERAAARGDQVLLHLPMEPESPGWDLGEGSVTTAMASDAIYREVLRGLDSLPEASAVNNHMGSKATADPRVVRTVLQAVKERGMFFLDSRTTSESVVGEIAQELGVPTLGNDRFIDPDLDPERVKERLLRAADLARERGWAIVIGHVHPETYEGVVRALPEIKRRGIRLAHLSDVLEKVRGNGRPLANSRPLK